MNLLAKKHEMYYYSLSVQHGRKTDHFRTPEFMTGKTFSFSHCISTLFIWCCRVCYFAWWTRLLRENHPTLFFIEKMGSLKPLCLRARKSHIWHWLWWTLDSVQLPLVIKPKILKEALQWRSERWAQVERYVVTSIKRNKRIEPVQCNVLHSCKSERHFRSKDQTPSHGAGHSGPELPKFFCASPKFFCAQKNLS